MGGQILIFFSDRSFSTLCSAIDCRMKALRKAGSVPRQTECLSEKDEELLWRKGLLGGDSPDSLHDTMVFMCGLFFALHGGEELRRLKRQQLSLEELSTGEKYIMFRENGSKNNPGGISCRQYSNKEVPHFENKKNPSRDFVSLYCKYISKCPHEPATEFFFFAK